MPESSETPTGAADPSAIRRRRRWLVAFALLGVATVLSVVAVEMFAGESRELARDRELSGATRPVVLERFDLKPKSGKKRRGVAQFVRRDDDTYLRMIAAGLSATRTGEAYQASLSRRGESKVLGARPVDSKGVFLGQVRIGTDELHSYDRIELRLVGADTAEAGRLILRGTIPG